MMKYRIAVLAVAVGATFCVQAQVKPEDQIKLRKAAYSLMGYTFGGLDAMANGKRPFNKEEAARQAELLAHLARIPKGFFGEGTGPGAIETRAKPEIWTNRADFDAKMDKMVTATANLAQAANSAADAGGLKKAVSDADSACAACHDDYRVKRR